MAGEVDLKTPHVESAMGNYPNKAGQQAQKPQQLPRRHPRAAQDKTGAL